MRFHHNSFEAVRMLIYHGFIDKQYSYKRTLRPIWSKLRFISPEAPTTDLYNVDLEDYLRRVL